MGPMAGLDGRKISSPPGFDPGSSVAIQTELPGPLFNQCAGTNKLCLWLLLLMKGAEQGLGSEEGENERRLIKLGNEEVRNSHMFHVIFLK